MPVDMTRALCSPCAALWCKTQGWGETTTPARRVIAYWNEGGRSSESQPQLDPVQVVWPSGIDP